MSITITTQIVKMSGYDYLLPLQSHKKENSVLFYSVYPIIEPLVQYRVYMTKQHCATFIYCIVKYVLHIFNIITVLCTVVSLNDIIQDVTRYINRCVYVAMSVGPESLLLLKEIFSTEILSEFFICN